MQYYNIVVASFIWENTPSCLLVLTDITQRLKYEEELQTLDSYKDQLLTNVTHDLKTPLNCMIQMIDLIKDN